MSVKLLLVLQDEEKATDRRVRRIQRETSHVKEAVEAWLELGGCGVMTLTIPCGLKLKIYQVGSELLKEPPQIEVKYASEPLPMCGICGWPIPQEVAAELYSGEACHKVCVVKEQQQDM